MMLFHKLNRQSLKKNRKQTKEVAKEKEIIINSKEIKTVCLCHRFSTKEMGYISCHKKNNNKTNKMLSIYTLTYDRKYK